MRVRCDQCGNKALIAASQCPHCGHLLDIRNGFGELLPLEHCPTCDTHYPARQGACRWCGTKPESFRLAPFAWKGAGVIACIGLGWGAWAASRGMNESPGKAKDGQLTTVVDSGLAARRRAHVAVADTALDSLLAAVATMDTTAPMELGDTLAAQPPTTEPVAEPVPSPAVIDSAPIRPAPSVSARVPLSSKVSTYRAGVVTPTPTPTPKTTRAARWVRATARNWVIVRASASPRSRVVASIGPDTRVQLGEARGDWIRVRMKGINGWVERSRF